MMHGTAFGLPRMPLPLAAAAALCVAVPLGLLSAVRPEAAVAAILAIAVAAAFVSNMTFALCGFVGLTYFQSIALITGSTFSPIKLAGGLLIATVLLRALAERGSLHAARPPGTVSAFMPLNLLLVGISLLAAGSLVWASSVAEARGNLVRLLTMVAAYFCVRAIVVRREQLERLWWTIAVAASLAALLGLALAAQGGAARNSGTFLDPNEYAAALLVAICLGYGLWDSAASRRARLAAAGCVGICTFALLGSQSRGGMLGMVLAFAALGLTARGRERLRMLGAGLVVVAVVAGFLVTPGGKLLTERLSDTDSAGRTDLWHIAIKETKSNPFGGVGIGNFPVVSGHFLDSTVTNPEVAVDDPRTTHSFYLQMFAELGLLGGMATLAFLAGTFALAVQGLREARRMGDRMLVGYGRSLVAALVGLLTCNVFLSGQYQEILWVVLAAAPAYALLVRRAAADA